MCLKVLIIDDHKLMALALRDALDDVDDLRVVGVAHSGRDGLSMLTRTQPDVVLLDMDMPGMSGLECLDVARRDYPSVKVVMISDGNDLSVMRDSFRRGAVAYIAKTVDPGDLPAALRHVCEGTVYHAPSLDDSAPDPTREAGLTERELAMLKAVARGLSNKAISKEFWITEQTVKFHLNNVYRKLGVPNRTAAAGFAHAQGLIESAETVA
jgi:NarL family two-component system response regulator LiaR